MSTTSDSVDSDTSSVRAATAPVGRINQSSVVSKVNAQGVQVIAQGAGDLDASDDDSDSGKGKAKGKGKGKAKGKTKGKGKGKAKKKSSVSLEAIMKSDADSIYADVARDFMLGQPYGVEVAHIIDVDNSTVSAKYDKYLEKLSKKRSTLKRNNLVSKRVYHGTLLECDLGITDGKLETCGSDDCRLCQILENGFSLDHAGTGGRNLPALAAETFPCRWGKGLYFCEQAAGVTEYSTCHPSGTGKKGLTAVLAVQAATGKTESVWEHDCTKSGPSAGYDSVSGEIADDAHPLGNLYSYTETVLYNENALNVTQIILFKHTGKLCPACGIQVYFGESTPVEGEFGTFCSDDCQTAFSGRLQHAYEKMQKTPTLSDPSRHPMWAVTNSTENCVLVDLWLGSKEASVVSMKLLTTMPNAEISKIYRVQNSFLFEKYYYEKERIARKNGGDANELLLWHGTSSTDPSEVYDTEDGFDFRFSSWGMWGTGSYFACNSSYSTNYAFTEANGYKTMFLAKVIAGDAADIPSDSSLKMPPEKSADTTRQAAVLAGSESDDISSGDDAEQAATQSVTEVKFKRTRYDSCTGETGGSRIYVVYAPPKAYPAYLVTYKNDFNY